MGTRIVVATDFSPAGAAALEWGALVALAHDAPLELVHVVEPIPPAGDELAAPADLGARLEEAAREQLEELAAPRREAGVAVRCQALLGRPWSVVIDAAERLDADLIVVGTRSHPAATRFPLGSTAARILQKAARPVLAVHPEDRAPARLPRRVLLPTDATDDVREAAARAIDLFLLPPGEASLLLFHAWAQVPDLILSERMGDSFFAAYREERLENAHRTLEKAAAELRGRGFEVESLVREGRPAEQIVDLAAERGIGLVAMRTRGSEGLDRLLWGSVAQQVVQHAPCPVLTVPGR